MAATSDMKPAISFVKEGSKFSPKESDSVEITRYDPAEATLPIEKDKLSPKKSEGLKIKYYDPEKAASPIRKSEFLQKEYDDLEIAFPQNKFDKNMNFHVPEAVSQSVMAATSDMKPAIPFAKESGFLPEESDDLELQLYVSTKITLPIEKDKCLQEKSDSLDIMILQK